VPDLSGGHKSIPFLEKVDADLAETERQNGCRYCDGKLHRANYQRKPRGLKCWPKDPKDTQRHSFCCNRKDCRRRHTPPSVRFLGRRVYGGIVAVLIPAMAQGLKPERMAKIRQVLELKIDSRTLARWRQWWQEHFVGSAFWKEFRARFLPPLCPQTLPLSLCLSFQVEERRDRLLALLQFLAPITTPEVWDELVR